MTRLSGLWPAARRTARQNVTRHPSSWRATRHALISLERCSIASAVLHRSVKTTPPRSCQRTRALFKEPYMSPGETAYLVLVVTAFVSYIGVLAYGVAVASERPDGRVSDSRARQEKTARGSGAAHAH